MRLHILRTRICQLGSTVYPVQWAKPNCLCALTHSHVHCVAPLHLSSCNQHVQRVPGDPLAGSEPGNFDPLGEDLHEREKLEAIAKSFEEKYVSLLLAVCHGAQFCDVIGCCCSMFAGTWTEEKEAKASRPGMLIVLSLLNESKIRIAVYRISLTEVMGTMCQTRLWMTVNWWVKVLLTYVFALRVFRHWSSRLAKTDVGGDEKVHLYIRSIYMLLVHVIQ